MLIPLALTVVAYAVGSIVWYSVEHEAQHAADVAAVDAAARAFLADFPYDLLEYDGLEFPTVETIAAELAANDVAAPSLQTLTNGTELEGTDPTAGVPTSPCETIGVVPPEAAAPETPDGVTLPADCSGVTPYSLPVPDLTGVAPSACATAEEAMKEESAPLAHKFYGGEGDSQPTCGNGRIRLSARTGTPLTGFTTDIVDAVTGELTPTVPAQLETLAQMAAAYGIHLNTALPNLMCPQVDVEIDQPVDEPLFGRTAEPNGRASAYRVPKNAVMVPIYQGQHITSFSSGGVQLGVAGETVVGHDGVSQNVEVPPVNLNTDVLQPLQSNLLALLDDIDALIAGVAHTAGVSIDYLSGTVGPVDMTPVDEPEGEEDPTVSDSVPGGVDAGTLRPTACLRRTISALFDPPGGDDAPTVQEVLENAAATGEPVLAVQLGVLPSEDYDGISPSTCAASATVATLSPSPAPEPELPETLPSPEDLEPPALPDPEDISTPSPSATANADPQHCVDLVTQPGVINDIYAVPFFDVTPVLVQDIGSHNFAALPVHATQAQGAFRAALIRDAADDRYDPQVDSDAAATAPPCVEERPLGTACEAVTSIGDLFPPTCPELVAEAEAEGTVPPTFCAVITGEGLSTLTGLLPDPDDVPLDPPPLDPVPTEVPTEPLPTEVPTVPIVEPTALLSPEPSPSESPSPSPSATCLLGLCP